MDLAKATLRNVDYKNEPNHPDHIKFMFNPNQLSFSRSISLEQSAGARTPSGENKTSFKHPNPYSVTISNIILDTYEIKESVLPHIQKFTKAVEFTDGGNGQNKRPPIYLLTWGSNNYLRCFVKTFNFKLTLFLSDGTPVRATVDLTLEQVDAPTPSPGQGVASPSQAMREASGRDTFLR